MEQALSEYNALVADEWLREAHTQAKCYSKDAIETLAELMQPGYSPQIRLSAARAMANKYLPDRQLSKSVLQEADEIPKELQEVIEKILA